MTVSFDHVSLASPDLERAVRFYRNVMGFEEVSRRETQAVFRIDDGLLVIFHGPDQYEEKPKHPRSGVHHLAFCIESADYDALLDRLKENDIRIMMQENNDGAKGIGFATYFYDPDGNTVEIKKYPPVPNFEDYTAEDFNF